MHSKNVPKHISTHRHTLKLTKDIFIFFLFENKHFAEVTNLVINFICHIKVHILVHLFSTHLSLCPCNEVESSKLTVNVSRNTSSYNVIILDFLLMKISFVLRKQLYIKYVLENTSKLYRDQIYRSF